MGKIIEKSKINSLLEDIKKDYELIAPIKTDVVRYDVVDNVSDINLIDQPYYSFKNYIQPPEFKIADIEDGELDFSYKIPKRVIFGAWMCDLKSIPMVDKLFLEEPADPYYKAVRENTIFMGVMSKDQKKDQYLFSDRVDIKPYYDLLFYDLGSKYHIEIGSEKGRQFVKDLDDHEFRIPKEASKDQLVDIDISDKFDDPRWDAEDANKLCFGCGTCTTMCPTCLCFSIKDDVNLDLKTGERKINWESCQLEDFTKVAGNEVFRKPRIQRFKHRIYHKIQYFKDRYGIPFCTGCGRCIRYCPTKIDYIKIVDDLK